MFISIRCLRLSFSFISSQGAKFAFFLQTEKEKSLFFILSLFIRITGYGKV